MLPTVLEDEARVTDWNVVEVDVIVSIELDEARLSTKVLMSS